MSNPNMPKWASGLVAEVCIDYHRPDPPAVTWRRFGKRYAGFTRIVPGGAYGARQPIFARPEHSSGHAKHSGDAIVVTAGTSRVDQKLVLLHELAHWLVGPKEWHSSAFWDRAFELYRRYGVPMRYAKQREEHYRKEAGKAYKRNVAAQREPDA